MEFTVKIQDFVIGVEIDQNIIDAIIESHRENRANESEAGIFLKGSDSMRLGTIRFCQLGSN